LSFAIDVVFKVELRSLVAVRQPRTLRATISRALATGRREGPAQNFARVNSQIDTANVQAEARRREREERTVMSVGARVGCVGDLPIEFVRTTRNGRRKRAGTYSGPYPSGAAFVSYNDDGSRDFVHNVVLSAAARFDGDDATIAALDAFGLDVMHVSGSASSDEGMCAKVLRVCKALHAKRATISFDPNVRKELVGNPAYFAAAGKMVDMTGIFLPSEDDAAAPFPGRDLESVAAELFAKGARCVVQRKPTTAARG
jgi:hypothetical protein